MKCEIIAIGSEMLTPYRQDTNSLYLTERLNELGVSVAFKTIVGDNLEHLTSAARIAIAPNNAKQADRLDSAEILENANGSAPGQYIDTVVGRHRKIVVLLP